VKLSDWFKPKSNAPKGLVPMNVTFTADEQKAMSRATERFNAVLKNDTPEGTQIFMAPKVASAISAQGLTEYVEVLRREIKSSHYAAATTNLVDKAVKAQGKAYALHNLPIYLFDLAGIYKRAGNEAKNQEFSQLFQHAQDKFEPDEIDRIFMELIVSVEELRDEGCDITPELKDQLNRVVVAKQLIESGFMCFSKR